MFTTSLFAFLTFNGLPLCLVFLLVRTPGNFKSMRLAKIALEIAAQFMCLHQVSELLEERRDFMHVYNLNLQMLQIDKSTDMGDYTISSLIGAILRDFMLRVVNI